MICGVAVGANPGLAGSSPGRSRHRTPRRAARPRPPLHRHHKRPAAATGANAQRGPHALSPAGATPQSRFDRGSYKPSLEQDLWPVNWLQMRDLGSEPGFDAARAHQAPARAASYRANTPKATRKKQAQPLRPETRTPAMIRAMPHTGRAIRPPRSASLSRGRGPSLRSEGAVNVEALPACAGLNSPVRGSNQRALAPGFTASALSATVPPTGR